MNPLHILVLYEGRALIPWQMDLIQNFAHLIGEEWLIASLAQNNFYLPVGTRMWFYRVNTLTMGFLWAQQQGTEANGKVLRVHALYISPDTHPRRSKLITRAFEECLNEYARLRGITELGFYTKRNPKAFARRLNVTAPKGRKWTLNSYVLTRKVE